MRRLSLNEKLKSPKDDAKTMDKSLQTALEEYDNKKIIKYIKSNSKKPDLLNAVNKHKQTILLWAIEHKNVEVLTELLKHQGVKVDYRNPHSYSAIFQPLISKKLEYDNKLAIMLAIASDDLDIVHLIAGYNNAVNINVIGSDDHSALMMAVHRGRIDMIKALIKHGADVNLMNELGKSALIMAVEKNNLELVNCLLELDRINVCAQLNNHNNALHVAARLDHIAVMKALLTHKTADVNSCNNVDHETPLMLAARYEQVGIIDLLLDCKEQINVALTNIHGLTALQIAIQSQPPRSRAVAEFISHQIFGETDLMRWAIENNFNNVVDALLTAPQYNVNAHHQDGHTWLTWAISKDNLSLVKKLLRRPGINVNMAKHNGETPLSMALDLVDANPHNDDIALAVLANSELNPNRLLRTGELPINFAIRKCPHLVDHLLKIPSIRVNAVDEQDESALILACRCKRSELALKLIRLHQADVNTISKKGYTALDVALANGLVAEVILEILTHTNANVNDRYKRNDTALVGVARNGYIEIVRYLLNLPTILINKRGGLEQTALMAAAQNGHLEIVNFLLAHGADDLAVDLQGNTALNLAAARGHTLLVKNLLLHSDKQIDIRNRAGCTPLLSAIMNAHRDTALAIIHGPVDIVNIPDNEGIAPLIHAITKNQVSVAADLIGSQSINLAVRDAKGKTPLILATEKNITEMVTLLLMKDPTLVNVQDENQDTALIISARNHDNLEIIEDLLKAGADPRIRNRQHYSAELAAIGAGHTVICAVLQGASRDYLLQNQADAYNAPPDNNQLFLPSAPPLADLPPIPSAPPTDEEDKEACQTPPGTVQFGMFGAPSPSDAEPALDTEPALVQSRESKHTI